jgi:hypothetical protein
VITGSEAIFYRQVTEIISAEIGKVLTIYSIALKKLS